MFKKKREGNIGSCPHVPMRASLEMSHASDANKFDEDEETGHVCYW